ncbi:uncharacterized protein LOC142767405 isoform X2 [Rhipicephalus microplus]|uniref:uncharacterized protein LOC142767405 isoform X2 n=1 Tax=Rhipicephalus microplus TaxID=6941 RepID=UPI003F6AF66A
MNSLYREHLRNFARNVCSFRCNVLTGHRASMQLYGAARCTCGLRPCGCRTFVWAPRMRCCMFGWAGHDTSARHRGGRR